MPTIPQDILDRIHAPYFEVRATDLGPPQDLDIDTVCVTNGFPFPISIFLLSAFGPDWIETPFSADAPVESLVEQGDTKHIGDAEQQFLNAVSAAAKSGTLNELAPKQSVSIPANSLLPTSLYQMFQVKVVATATGSVIGFWTFDPKDIQGRVLNMVLGTQLIQPPNGIGLPPSPTDLSPLPANSPRIVVDYGPLRDPGKYLLHEQAWRRAASSYCLAPGEKKTVIYTTKTGVTSVSDQVESIAAAMSLTTGGGWAGITVAVSASLSADRTVSRSQTIVNEASTELMDEVVNPNPTNPVLVLFWELTDIYSVCKDFQELASFEVTQAPPIIQQYPQPTGLPKPQTLAQGQGNNG